jgi:hypothetical protein
MLLSSLSMADVYLPPGWPPGVAPPGTDDWEATAVEFPVKSFCSTDPQFLTLLGRPYVTPA